MQMPTPVNTIVSIPLPSAALQAAQAAPVALPTAPEPGQAQDNTPVALPTVPEPGQAQQATPDTPTAAQAGSQQLKAQLDESLKNSGIKAEIENEKAGLVIVRFVQADTGRVILQMPPQGVLDLVAQMEKQPESSPLAGNMVDTSV